MRKIKKILRGIGYVCACVVMLFITVFMSLVRESIHKSFTEKEDISVLATSQEIDETSIVKETETTKATPTGTVSVHSVGMATTVESISEPVVITCQWNRTIELTQSELELLYTTVYCESGGEALEAQIMVAQTILNRMISNKYPDTLRGVVYQRNSAGQPQFAVINWPDFEKRGWTDDTMTAVHYALSHKGYPEDMLYFRDSHYHDFGQPYKNVDDMYFSLAE